MHDQKYIVVFVIKLEEKTRYSNTEIFLYVYTVWWGYLVFFFQN